MEQGRGIYAGRGPLATVAGVPPRSPRLNDDEEVCVRIEERGILTTERALYMTCRNPVIFQGARRARAVQLSRCGGRVPR